MTIEWPGADHAERAFASWDRVSVEDGTRVVAAYEAVVVELTGGEPLEKGEVERVYGLVRRGLGGIADLRKSTAKGAPDEDRARIVRRLELRLRNATSTLLDRVRSEAVRETVGAQS